MKTVAGVQLSLYNEALRLVGERALASLAEAREPRRLLDVVWAANAIDTVLEKGQWKFALRSMSLTYSPSIEPAMGYRYAFDKPADLLRLCGMYRDSYFRDPLLDYLETGGFWFSDLDTIYLQYVSNDPAYGTDLTLWTNTFCKYVAVYLALEIAPRLSLSDAKKMDLEKMAKQRLLEAKSLDAMSEPTKMLPPGTWVQSRYGRSGRTGCR